MLLREHLRVRDGFRVHHHLLVSQTILSFTNSCLRPRHLNPQAASGAAKSWAKERQYCLNNPTGWKVDPVLICGILGQHFNKFMFENIQELAMWILCPSIQISARTKET